MGMSASQARLLSLTARLSDLELQAQSISNSKIRLAQQTEQAATEYTNALAKKTVTVMSGVDAATGAYQYVDASAYNLTTYDAVSKTDKQRFLSDNSGRILVMSRVGNAYDSSQNQVAGLHQQYSTVNAYLKATLGYSTSADAAAAGKTYDAKQVSYYTNLYSGEESFLNKLGYTSNPNNTDPTVKNDDGATSYYTNVFNEIAANGYNAPGDANMKDTDWLHSQLMAGNVSLVEWEEQGGNVGSGGFDKVSWTSDDPSIKENDDETAMTIAEAKYNTELAAIQVKDKTFDLELKNIDTEHNAIQTEIESVKKVIDKNIERTFKIFNA